MMFFFASRRRHTRCALVTGVQTCALPIWVVLNIADRAVARLEMDNDSIRFTARFGGVSHPVTVPISAVLAIYARETGQGMALPDDVGGNGEQAQSGVDAAADAADPATGRSEEHTSELQSLMRISYAVFRLKK